ncbi:MAG: adenylosuccinate lyase [Candidatus Thorarchaeota archaeon]
MPVSPIDYGRYGHPDMVTVFEEEHRHSLWLSIEATVAEVQAEMDLIPKEAAKDIRKTAKPDIVTLERTMEIEKITRHDVVALFEAIAEKCEGPGARWIHFGLTSNDIKDTALGLQLNAAFDLLIPQIDTLCKSLLDRAKETQDLIAVGRSHGQHAVPITYGIRFTVWLEAVQRHMNRIHSAKETTRVGKISGATGSHAALGPLGFDIQKRVLETLGLNVPIATTQIIQRDRLAEAVTSLANLASTIDKIATDLRNLQRTEIAETYEPFAKGKQVGSSAMPHKRNPVTCEKLSGLARIVRSLVPPALENVVSWEERDISHSSAERFIIPQAFILTDYMVREMNRVIGGLEIDTKAVDKNLNLSNDSILSEYVVTLLTKAGLERPKAHEKLRALSNSAKAADTSLLDAVRKDIDLSSILDMKQLQLEEYYNNIREVSRRIVREAEEAHKK